MPMSCNFSSSPALSHSTHRIAVSEDSVAGNHLDDITLPFSPFKRSDIDKGDGVLVTDAFD